MGKKKKLKEKKEYKLNLIIRKILINKLKLLWLKTKANCKQAWMSHKSDCKLTSSLVKYLREEIL